MRLLTPPSLVFLLCVFSRLPTPSLGYLELTDSGITDKVGAFATHVAEHFNLIDTPEEEDSCSELFETWLEKYNRSYKSDKEYKKRLHTFCESVKFVAEFNSKSTSSHKVEVNQYADMTDEEYQQQLLGGKQVKKHFETLTSENLEDFRYEDVDPPSEVNYKEQGALAPIKNQGQCGGCWAFATTGSIEALHYLTTGKHVSLSEQQLISCSSPEGNEGCVGGAAIYAYEYVKQNGGLNTEKAYPYEAETGTCDRSLEQVKVASIDSFSRVPINDEEALMKAVSKQPVAVSIEADSMGFKFYSGGVFQSECGHDRDHAVLVVGYGADKEGTKYWLVRNSWGPDWGEEGYIRMARGVDAPYGKCGLLMEPVFPVSKASRPPPAHAMSPPPPPLVMCDQYTECSAPSSCCCALKLGDYCVNYTCESECAHEDM